MRSRMTLESLYKKALLIRKQATYKISFGKSVSNDRTVSHGTVRKIYNILREAANNLVKNEKDVARDAASKLTDGLNKDQYKKVQAYVNLVKSGKTPQTDAYNTEKDSTAPTSSSNEPDTVSNDTSDENDGNDNDSNNSETSESSEESDNTQNASDDTSDEANDNNPLASNNENASGNNNDSNSSNEYNFEP